MENEIKKLERKLAQAEKKIDTYEEEMSQSPAMTLTKTLKKECFWKNIIIVILIVALIGSFCYTLYLLNDFEYTETTTSEVVDMDSQEGNNNYVNGDNSDTITNN
jgi:zona occludens toxin (predicted ATPase)